VTCDAGLMDEEETKNQLIIAKADIKPDTDDDDDDEAIMLNQTTSKLRVEMIEGRGNNARRRGNAANTAPQTYQTRRRPR